MPAEPARPGRPAPLAGAAVLTALEGGALVLLGLWYAGKSLVDAPASLARAELAALMALAAGLGLLVLALALRRAARWARTPVVVVQLLALPVGVGLLQAHLLGYGVPILAVALGLLGLLATPAARRVFLD